MVDISFVIWSTREEESIICEDFMMASRSLVLYDCPPLYLCPASSLIPSSTQDFFFWLVGFKSRIKCLSWDHYELNMAKYARSGLSINMFWILVSCLFMSSTFFHPSLIFVFSWSACALEDMSLFCYCYNLQASFTSAVFFKFSLSSTKPSFTIIYYQTGYILFMTCLSNHCTHKLHSEFLSVPTYSYSSPNAVSRCFNFEERSCWRCRPNGC